MNDDELIERLRRTLRAEADAVTPMRGTPRVMPRRLPAHRRTLGVPNRALVALSAAAVIVVAIIGVAVGLGGHHARTGINVTSPNTSTTATTTRRHHRAHIPVSSVLTTPTTPTTVTEPTTSPTTAPSQTNPGMAAGFAPLSVTFVTAAQGWVLGTEACGAQTCLRLGQTSDGGATWTDGSVTGVSSAALAAVTDHDLQVRFADAYDGWIYDTAPGAGFLWSTQDGGATWTQATLPGGAGATIDSLETAQGQVTAAVVSSTGAVYVDTTAASAVGGWTEATTLAGGPSSATTATVVLQQTAGWVVVDNGGMTIGGAELNGATWAPWTSVPCTTGHAGLLLAAPTDMDLTAVCRPVDGSRPEVVYASHDGGATFEKVGRVMASDAVTIVSGTSGGTIVGVSLASPNVLVASFTGGVDWNQVWAAPAGTIIQVGFENATQGVAVVDAAGGGQVVMTTDGGKTWDPIDLQS
jgi:hypothetical protein